MTPMLRFVVIVVSIFLAVFVLRKIRQSKMKIEDAIFWVGAAFLLVVFSIFPRSADILSRLVGTYSTANFIFMFMIFILLMKVFSLSIKVSQLESRVTELVQLLALEKTEREDISRNEEDGEKNFGIG